MYFVKKIFRLLEIHYSTGLGVVYISPIDKQLFIEKLNHQIAQADTLLRIAHDLGCEVEDLLE